MDDLEATRRKALYGLATCLEQARAMFPAVSYYCELLGQTCRLTADAIGEGAGSDDALVAFIGGGRSGLVDLAWPQRDALTPRERPRDPFGGA